MKKELVGIFVCILLIVTVLPVTGIQRSYDFKLSDKSLLNNSNWTEKQKLFASDGNGINHFGHSVSIDGDVALVGAYRDDDNGEYSGSAYIYKLINTTWIEQAKLIPSDGEEGDGFGCSVSLHDDTALIGAWHDDDNGEGSGSAYVFIKDGNNWIQQAKLLPYDGKIKMYFGLGVSIHGDTALIGAGGDNIYGNMSGSAYVFIRNDNTWNHQAKLIPSDGDERDYFGWRSVSIDGDIAIIGSNNDDDKGENSGSAYVFQRIGTIWVEQTKLLSSDGEKKDNFGCSVFLDGETALIGATGDDDWYACTGSAYVFTLNGDNWIEQAKLFPPDPNYLGYFGYSVSIKGDTALIGAEGNNSAYIFNRYGNNWTKKAKLLPSDGVDRDHFGCSVSIDGMYAFIGSESNNNGLSRGSAYVFIDNEKPITPKICGPKKVKPETMYDYYFGNCVDPEGSNMTYYVDWGDGNVEEGFVESGSIFNLSHNWTRKGVYIISAKLIDNYGLESDLATLEITVPRTRVRLRLLDMFPIFQRFLNYFL